LAGSSIGITSACDECATTYPRFRLGSEFVIGKKTSLVKLGAVLAVAAIAGLAILVATKESRARSASQQAHDVLASVIDAGDTLTDEQVHGRLGRLPNRKWRPAKHRLVEEYRWSGSSGSHTVYVYYTTGAARLLTAVSLNQMLPDWEPRQESR
jgi:hypothetical protein